jgi:hypothetical protein
MPAASAVTLNSAKQSHTKKLSEYNAHSKGYEYAKTSTMGID